MNTIQKLQEWSAEADGPKGTSLSSYLTQVADA